MMGIEAQRASDRARGTGRAGRMAARLLASAGVAALSACAAVPGAGPATEAMLSAPTARSAPAGAAEPFALVPMTLERAQVVNAAFQIDAPRVPRRFFADAPPPPVRIAVGDTVEVSIVSTSADSGYLDFASSSISPLSTTTLPAQEVDAAGRIHVPPAGRLRVAGASEAAVEARLAEQLGRVLIDPRVIVRVTDRAKARAAVFGAVRTPGRYALDPEATRLLDLLGHAGGAAGRSEEQELTLTRGGETLTVPLDAALSDPAYDIRIWPGDVVEIAPRADRFVAFGAVGRGGVAVEYAQPGYTLAQALSAAGGPVTGDADRRGVFLLRLTPPEILSDLGVVSPPPGPAAPTVYQFDMSRPATLFAAARFEMRDGDMLYVSDSPITEARKILGLVSDVTGPTTTWITTAE